jgi:hypothetical protein
MYVVPPPSLPPSLRLASPPFGSLVSIPVPFVCLHLCVLLWW